MSAANTFHLIVASVGETFFDGAALSATPPTSAGEITVLPHHEPLVTTLEEGTITVRVGSDESKEFSVASGVLEMSGNRAAVLLQSRVSFTKKKEDFVCAHCGLCVRGTGYTNHCPGCLWSKHVDVDPGDRASACGGMMEPMALIGSTPKYRIVHRCLLCGTVRRVGVSASDNAESVLALSSKGGIMDA